MIFRRTYIRALLSGNTTRLYVFLKVFLGVSPVFAAMQLDKLTACDEIARLYSGFKSSAAVATADCRPPSTAMERVLAGRLEGGTSRLCFLRATPAAFLNGFSCIRRREGSTSDLTCFRAASLSDIQVYKEQYRPKYAEADSKYLAAARQCSVSNGDSAMAPSSTFPPLLKVVSRFELGYITSLGTRRPSDSTISHGFAETDPAIVGDGPRALEFVGLLVNAVEPKGGQKSVGGWAIETNKMGREDVRQVNQQFAKNGSSGRVKELVTYALERSDGKRVDGEGKSQLIRYVHAALAEDFKSEGFAELPASKIRATIGKNPEEFVQEAFGNTVFGTQGQVRMASSFKLLVNENARACAKSGYRAIVIYLFASQPIDEVQDDFGSVTVAIAGFGACAQEAGPIRTYAEGLIDEATQGVEAALQKR